MKQRFFLGLLLPMVAACSSGGSSGGGAPAAPSAASPAPIASEETAAPAPTCPEGTAFSQTAGKVVANVSFDGRPPLKVVLDTGADRTIVKSSVGAKASGADVTVAGRTVHLDHVTIDDATIATLRMPEVQAVLGADVFGHFAFTLDYLRGRMMLDESVDDAALAACQHIESPREWVPMKTIGGALYVQGNMEDVAGWLLLDTGASFGVLTSSTYEALAAKRPRVALSGFYTPAAIGTFWAKLTAVERVEVGGLGAAHVLSRTVDDGLMPSGPGGASLLGVVPSDFFGRTLVTFDYPRRRVRFALGKDQPERLPSKFFPVGISLEEKLDPPIHVAAVLPGSAAAEGDVAAGDEIVAVDGRAIATMDPYARAWSLGAGTMGATLAVKLRRGDVERELSLVTRDLL